MNDRVCVGSTPQNAIVTRGCQLVEPNSLRGDPLFQLDTRFGWAYKFKEHMALRLYWEMYNIFNTLNTGNNVNNICGAGFTSAAGAPCSTSFGTAIGYFGGQGFGAPTSGPLRTQFGFRFEF